MPRAWELDTGRVLATFEGHTAWVRACAVTPDGRRVVSTSDDRTLKAWEACGATDEEQLNPTPQRS